MEDEFGTIIKDDGIVQILDLIRGEEEADAVTRGIVHQDTIQVIGSDPCLLLPLDIVCPNIRVRANTGKTKVRTDGTT